VAFSHGENMRLRSTASTAFSIHCSSYARDVRWNVYFFFVEQDLRQDRHLPFTSPNVQMTPFTAGFCFALSSMSLTVRFLAFLCVYTMKSIRRRDRSWRSPTSRLHTTVDAFSLTDSSRKTIKSRFRKLLQTSSLWTVRFFFSISIDRSNFAS
jgi:hypothetical protein